MAPQPGVAIELFAKLDELTQTGVFGELYEAHVASAAFPPVAEAYRLLGLQLDEEGESLAHPSPEVAS